MSLDPHLLVVLGATGDLFRRKLLPAIHALATLADAGFQVLGVGSSDLDDESFRSMATEAALSAGVEAEAARSWCSRNLHYHRLGRNDPYDSLAARISSLEADHGLPGNRVFYLALPPQAFPEAIRRLGVAGLGASPGWVRLVVEKPFGRDTASSRSLNQEAHAHFGEDQIYRIDHYLGKETVQNLLIFRFANPIFEASWNRDRIERVEITVAESLDVEDRGAYYESSGAIRDMIQNHLTQLLSLVAMEPPVAFEAAAVREEKAKVVRSIRSVEPEHVVLGQYTPGLIGGEPVPGYLEIAEVAPDSTIPTYAAVRLHVDTWRWKGVPFILRTGKALKRRVTEIAVVFKPAPICLFHGEPDGCTSDTDVLYLTLQPDEGFALRIEVKEPGSSGDLHTIFLRFSYGDAFGDLPDAYATLLEDVVAGDQTLFVRSDWVEEAWRIYELILDAALPLDRYEPGTWGPARARHLLGPGEENWSTGGSESSSVGGPPAAG